MVVVRGTILRPRCTVNRDAAAADDDDAFQSSLKNRTEIKMTFCKEIAAAGGKKTKTTLAMPPPKLDLRVHFLSDGLTPP